MTNENPSEKVIKLFGLTKEALVGMITSKENEITRLKEKLAEYENQKNTMPMETGEEIGHRLEIQRLNNLIDTLKHGNQQLINTIAYQAMQLAGELKKNG